MYTADDEQQEAEKAAAANRAVDPSIKAGGLKKPHYHIMIMFIKEKRPSSLKNEKQKINGGWSC